MTARHGDPTQYDIRFRADKWDIPGESRKQAIERIAGDFRRLLTATIGEQERLLEDAPEVTKASEEFDPDGLKWLVRFQVLGKGYAEIAREDDGSKSLANIDPHDPQQWTTVVERKAKAAAKVLLGPEFTMSWLRPVKPGPAPGSGRKAPPGTKTKRRPSNSDYNPPRVSGY